jgi:hypothetical protein
MSGDVFDYRPQPRFRDFPAGSGRKSLERGAGRTGAGSKKRELDPAATCISEPWVPELGRSVWPTLRHTLRR